MGIQSLPGRLWSGVTRGFLAFSTALHAVAAGLGAQALALLSQIQDGGMAAVLAASTHEQVYDFLSVSLLTSYALVPVVVGLFLQRAHNNLTLLGAREFSYRPGTAITMWWVPGFNLVLPLLFAREVHRASSLLRSSRVTQTALWPLLWCAFVLGGMGLLARLVVDEPVTLAGMQLLAALDVTARVLSAVGLLGGLLAVRSVGRLQRDALQGRSTPPMAHMLGHAPDRQHVPVGSEQSTVRS